jgi:hypothetical protein
VSDISQGLLTLGAVVIGGIVSYIGASLTERIRWARERSSRWDHSRLDAYMQYARALKEEVRITLRIASGLGAGTSTDQLTLDEGRLLRQVAEHERSALFEGLLLLGDPATVEAARAWQGAAWDVYQYLLATDAPQNDEFIALYEIVGTKRDAFYRSARIGLEIFNGDYVSTELPSAMERRSRRF